MAHLIEFVLDWIVLLLSPTVFIIFLLHIHNFASGEGKKMFTLLTVFLGLNFLTFLIVDGFEILQFLTVKGEGSELEKSVEAAAHLFQVISLSVFLYIAILFRGFAKKLEKTRA
ncbi:hypothetical protein J4458_06915 [Candidatus Woesearchaeota archaeon]|nr:hypothetical protein [Candidatus Woesearchaeota archaeon]